MAEEPKAILLNGGRELGVTLVAGADEFLATILGGALAKSGPVSLQVVKNAADQPFVAIILGGKHVGFLSHTDAQGLLPTLAVCEQQGAVAQARGTVIAPPGGVGHAVLRVSLAEPGQLLAALQTEAAPSVVEAPKAQPVQPAQSMQPEPAVQLTAAAATGIVPQVPEQRGPELSHTPKTGGYCPDCGSVRQEGAAQCSCGHSFVTTEVTEQPAQPVDAMPAGGPGKKQGWWGRRSGAQKAGVIAGALAVLAIIGVVAGTTGGKAESATVTSSAITVAMPSTTNFLASTTTSNLVTVTEATPTTMLSAHGSLPDLVGLDLQFAQDTLQAAGWYYMTSYDTTGQDRMQILDRNWVVVEQTPAAGGMVSYDETIELGVVKKGEPGSEVLKGSEGLPDVAGENLQLAIDTMQAAGYDTFDYIDATGQGRTPIMHSNWVVLAQSPAPGTDLPTDGVITFTVKKEGE